MSADSQFIVVVTTTLALCCLVASITASSYDAQYPVCGKNEILSPTPVCCEPTCSNDCSTASFPENYVNQPVCVCKPGYVRHRSRCIRKICCPKNVTSTESPPTSTTVFYPRYNEKPRSYGSCPCRRKPILPTAKPYEPPKQPTFVPFKQAPNYASIYGPEPYIPNQPSSYDQDHLPSPHIPQKPSFDTDPTPKPYIPQAYGAYPNLRPFIYNGEEKVKSLSGIFHEHTHPQAYVYNPPEVQTFEPAPCHTTTTNPPFVTPCDDPVTPEPTPEPTPDIPKPCAPKCDPLQTLTVCRPCCVPTCENDCSNVRCTKICIAELNCVCLAGYVLHEGKCIRKEDCPAVVPPPCDKEKPVDETVFEYSPDEGYRRTGYTPRVEFSAEQLVASDDCNDYPDK
ncbi:uncharacterized protein LOC120424494 [Culex pipiens pallens]|uniref:uncharacterized protein LOC120424494 n=1 Tax=Culex pipiens pallens TaxID=42434 RepID=UPI001952AABE|nr:uncharacterized protein LOC120424494 [Culex pipiens pallens]